MNDHYDHIFSRIDYRFKNTEIFNKALTHKSYANEQEKPSFNNERLEFLGDSVLATIVSDELYKRFPHKSEGDLSKLRSAIVNEFSFYQMAEFLDLGKILFLGRGEIASGGRNKQRVLSRAFEALIGAVYADSDFLKASEVTLNIFKKYSKKHKNIFDENILNDFDPKTKLQELVLKKYPNPPEYKSKNLANGKFEIELIINNKTYFKEIGDSKRKTEKKLAKIFLEKNYEGSYLK